MNLDQHSIWSILLTVLGYVLWDNYRTLKLDVSRTAKQTEVDSLKTQNAKQETDIATLQANGNAHNINTERLASAIERLDTKIDQLSQSLLASRQPSARSRARR